MAVRAIRIVSSLEGRRFNDESVNAFHQRSRRVALIPAREAQHLLIVLA
jgi:hypothetical protein